MTLTDLIAFKDYILTENTYFKSGYANAVKDLETNRLFAYDDKGKRVEIFPTDNKGNYFFLRSDGDFRFDPRAAEKVADCKAQRVSFLDSLTIQLIAVMNKADEFILIENLRNTCMGYTALDVIPTAASYNRENIVTQELRGLKRPDIDAALARLKNQSIVRLTITVYKLFIPGNCVTDPCKPC